MADTPFQKKVLIVAVNPSGETVNLQADASGQLKTTVGGGGGGTEFAEDTAHSSGALGTLILAVRKDVAAALAGTDGDYIPFIVDANGRLHVALPPDAATQTTLAALLTELQAKADLAETQPVSAASLPLPTGAATETTLAAVKTALELIDNIIAGSEAQVDVVTLPALSAGANTVGAVKDAGPNVAGTYTYTSSADMTVAADIGPAPTLGQKSVLLQATISAAVAMEFTLQMETTAGAERVSFFLPANGSVVFVPRYPIKLGTADKKWQGKASAAGNVRIHTTTVSEA
jgi:hypothetical protein